MKITYLISTLLKLDEDGELGTEEAGAAFPLPSLLSLRDHKKEEQPFSTAAVLT